MSVDPYSLEGMQAALADAHAQKAAIEAEAQPLMAARDALVEQLAPLEAEMRSLGDQINTIRAPLYDIDQTISRLTRAMPDTPIVHFGQEE